MKCGVIARYASNWYSFNKIILYFFEGGVYFLWLNFNVLLLREVMAAIVIGRCLKSENVHNFFFSPPLSKSYFCVGWTEIVVLPCLPLIFHFL